MKAEQGETILEKLILSGKFSITLVVVLVAAIFASTNVLGVYAQKSKPAKSTAKKKNPVRKKLPMVIGEILQWSNNLCIPPESDYVSAIQIDKNSELTVTVQTKDDSKILVSNEPISSLEKVLSRLDKKSVIAVKADPTLDFGLVAKTLRDIRRITGGCANVEASAETDNRNVYFAPEPVPDYEPAMPNPLTLVVEIKQNKKISLNNEDEGSLNDVSTLVNKLKKIFKDREENGIFREGTNEVEKMLFVKAAPSIKFADVIKTVDAVKEAGASPVGLQIDDTENSFELPAPPRPKQ